MILEVEGMGFAHERISLGMLLCRDEPIFIYKVDLPIFQVS